jgi:hypothetical protein
VGATPAATATAVEVAVAAIAGWTFAAIAAERSGLVGVGKTSLPAAMRLVVLTASAGFVLLLIPAALVREGGRRRRRK